MKQPTAATLHMLFVSVHCCATASAAFAHGCYGAEREKAASSVHCRKAAVTGRPDGLTTWFSYDPPGFSANPDAPRIVVLPKTRAETDVFAGIAEEIVVIGERQRRDFLDVKPSDELTGPRALDAAQPVVPWIGTACSYKTLCYDMKQPPLREVFERLSGDAGAGLQFAAGCEARLSVPPKLTANFLKLSRSRNENASRSPPFTYTLIVEPGPLHWRPYRSASREPAGRCPRKPTFSMPGWLARNPATLPAFSPARVMRSTKVSRLRISSQPVCGSLMVPKALRMERIGFSAAREPSTAPATTSL